MRFWIKTLNQTVTAVIRNAINVIKDNYKYIKKIITIQEKNNENILVSSSWTGRRVMITVGFQRKWQKNKTWCWERPQWRWLITKFAICCEIFSHILRAFVFIETTDDEIVWIKSTVNVQNVIIQKLFPLSITT
jgi:hypothetical protein